jgi:quinol monooxygenase YgiN
VALEALIEPTRQEDGYVNYDLHQGVEDPDLFSFYENWVSGERLDAHLAAPHLVDRAAKMDDLLDDAGLSINRVPRIALDLCHRPPAARRAAPSRPAAASRTSSLLTATPSRPTT